MSKENEIDELRDEIEELKKIIGELKKSRTETYKNAGIHSEPLEPKSEIVREEEIDEEVRRKLDRDLEGIRAPRPPRAPEAPRPPLHPVPSDFDFKEFAKGLKEIYGRVEEVSKEGMKKAEKISEKVSKKVQKVIERETERIKEASKISKAELAEINGEINAARSELEAFIQELEMNRSVVRDVGQEIRAAQRRLDRARDRGNREEIREAQEELRESMEELREAEEEIREKRSEIAQARRDLARLQARAQKIHYAQKAVGPHARVIRLGDVDVDGTVTDYITKVVDSVSKNLEGTFKTAFGEGKKAIGKVAKLSKDDEGQFVLSLNGRKETVSLEELDEFFEKTSVMLSALGDDNRLKILKILEKSPEYQKELGEETGLKGGSFKHHTDILQETGYITREAVRGRYLITQLGIEALKLAEIIYQRKKSIEEEDEGIDIDID